MKITDDFPVGTKLVIEVVADVDNDCELCVFHNISDGFNCNINCCASFREDRTLVKFVLVEVKEP